MIHGPLEDDFYFLKVSPDGKTIASENLPVGNKIGWLCLVDVATGHSKFIDFGEEALPQDPIFDRTSKCVLLPTITFPKGSRFDEAFTNLPQPRIHVVDVATDNTLETMIAPRTFINSMAFSPDNKTLATSGPVEVMLWDFSTPPGAAHN